MKSALHTTDPIALRYLMSETLFLMEDDRAPVGENTPLPEATDLASLQEKPTMEPSVKQPLEFGFLGENKRGYVFVTDDPQSDYMSAPAMDAFLKTLGARQLGLPDVAVFNLAQHQGQVTFADLYTFFKPRVLVLLGPSSGGLGMFAIPSNTVGKMEDIPVFQTYSFDVLLVDNEKKAAFWPLLKSLLV